MRCQPSDRLIDDPGLADPGDAIANGLWSAQLCPAAACHHWVPTDPSGATQKTSRLLGVRAVAVIPPADATALGGVIVNHPWSAQLVARGRAVHQFEPSAPSLVTQNTSR